MTEDEVVHATTLGFTGPIWDGEEEQTHEQVTTELQEQTWERPHYTTCTATLSRPLYALT